MNQLAGEASHGGLPTAWSHRPQHVGAEEVEFKTQNNCNMSRGKSTGNKQNWEQKKKKEKVMASLIFHSMRPIYVK